MKELIIDAPHLQTGLQRAMVTTVTIAFWSLWCLLWTPVLTILTWYGAIDLVYAEMFELGGLTHFLADLFYIVIGVLVMTGSLAMWASYNYIRFRWECLRGVQKSVTNQELAQFFKVEEKSLSDWQKNKYLSVNFDDHGNITNIT